MPQFRFISCAALLFAAGCSTHVETNPARTAMEQLLISTAADRAAEKLAMGLPKNSKVFIDATNFEGTDSKYAIGSIRTALLKQGSGLVADKKLADVIVEPRSGALSTDQTSTLFGIPAIAIPVPLASGTLPFPEIALYKDAEQTGVAKFAVSTYDAKSGLLINAQDPQYGFAHKEDKTLLIFYSWTDNDAIPPEYKNGFQRDSEKLTNSNR